MTRRDVQDYAAELVALSEYQTSAAGLGSRVTRSETGSGLAPVIDLNAYREGRTR